MIDYSTEEEESHRVVDHYHQCYVPTEEMKESGRHHTELECQIWTEQPSHQPPASTK